MTSYFEKTIAVFILSVRILPLLRMQKRTITMHPHLPSGHVLLVDDSLDELRLLKEVLDAHQFKMSIAFDGHQGYQRAKTLHPDLILMDVRMPKLDGFGA